MSPPPVLVDLLGTFETLFSFVSTFLSKYLKYRVSESNSFVRQFVIRHTHSCQTRYYKHEHNTQLAVMDMSVKIYQTITRYEVYS